MSLILVAPVAASPRRPVACRPVVASPAVPSPAVPSPVVPASRRILPVSSTKREAIDGHMAHVALIDERPPRPAEITPHHNAATICWHGAARRRSIDLRPPDQRPIGGVPK